MGTDLRLIAIAGLMALAAVAVVVVLALRRRSAPGGPEADYDDAPRRPSG